MVAAGRASPASDVTENHSSLHLSTRNKHGNRLSLRERGDCAESLTTRAVPPPPLLLPVGGREGEGFYSASETTARGQALEASARLFLRPRLRTQASGPPALRYLLTPARGARCEETVYIYMYVHTHTLTHIHTSTYVYVKC